MAIARSPKKGRPMALHAQRLFNSQGKTAPGDPVREANRELLVPTHVHPVGALRGLLIALLLVAPFWIALYFLLR